MPVRNVCAAALLGCAAMGVCAQLVDNPDWKEVDAPPPPEFRIDRLIKLDSPRASSLQFGVDPATISVGSDDVVRYVVVASNRDGAFNALYEGIRCSTGEMKTYARFSGTGPWTIAKNAEWQRLRDQPSRHAFELARNGVCMDAVPNKPVQNILRALRTPTDMRLKSAG